MSTRRNFIGTAAAGIAAVSLLPAVNTFASEDKAYKRQFAAKPKLRFALASDIHYGQQGTDYAAYTSSMVRWLNDDHAKNHLDLVIINGDLVHNRPDLLPEIKKKYLDKLDVPCYTIPGNHDFADAGIWKTVFGYEDKYFIEMDEVAFVFANTADTKGGYVCPDNAFLKDTLDKLTDKKIVFVILHIAPVQWLKTEATIFLNCPETVSLLHSYPNVKAAFHGHDHTLDGVRYTDKLPHFFDSHIGGNWGTDYRGYRIVEVHEDNTIYTYQVNASQNPVLNANKF
ncbi:3',5'-cyclic AMP phosphodiesterase CpdA [Mucilaginibacter frigoritolerans]|uniref:3',5'-cyclic AMP phosphodiesterase CpdA n=1 Tax=Mucilaginibacter frigoritolerans TaxID=652788 RepID=A0A562U6Y3_9SPHI|nr:metallophosphoesterase [Mucilaginibacter frigoritolerans]TWJ01583.1 3',5'-cyclic AMP phosphodiesterase CpdA [Mucilaginibacter frigoritolerans]